MSGEGIEGNVDGRYASCNKTCKNFLGGDLHKTEQDNIQFWINCFQTTIKTKYDGKKAKRLKKSRKGEIRDRAFLHELVCF